MVHGYGINYNINNNRNRYIFMIQQHLIQSEAKHLKLEFRMNRIALIFTNFGGDDLNTISEMIYSGCSQVETTQKVIEYDPTIGAIILVMKKGYNEKIAIDEITEILICMNDLCPTIAHT